MLKKVTHLITIIMNQKQLWLWKSEGHYYYYEWKIVMTLEICISLLLICHYFTFITEFKITPAKTCLRWVTRPICIISSQSPSRCGKLLLARVMCGFLHKSCYFYITGETMIDLILIQGPPCLWIFSWFPPFSDHYSIATLPPLPFLGQYRPVKKNPIKANF